MQKTLLLCVLSVFLFWRASFSQIVINEGSNRNYTTIADEDGEYEDWIELFNTDSDTVSLAGFSLTDDSLIPLKWTFPAINMLPGEYKTVFCSGKDRKPISGFTNVLTANNYTPGTGWDTHTFTTPFYWDGVSNVVINVCSYVGTGYTLNSVFNQSATTFNSTLFSFIDGSDASCGAQGGNVVAQRPNLQLNGQTIGMGNIQNSGTDYPAPYGNWYWSARHQILVRASELQAAGLSAGMITSLAFDVVSNPAGLIYDYIDISMNLVSFDELSTTFEQLNTTVNQHTNFSISQDGEKIFLYDPSQNIESSLFVHVENLNNSCGLLPDASSNTVLFDPPTPNSTNNGSTPYTGYLTAPVFSSASGIYGSTVNVTITHTNSPGAQIYYTIDGSEPTLSSTLYTGVAIPIFYSQVLKARVIQAGILPSPITTASYLMGITHGTPILSLTTAPENLTGPTGIFDNWMFDWEKEAYADYFDENQQLVFSQNTGLQIDGGWGGSRSHPQHSFRLELDDGVLGDGRVNEQLIPNRPDRDRFEKLYFRNGSNQWLQFPYKDAFLQEVLSGTTKNAFSAMRPVSVYINGSYFGLYEMREKIDEEFFKVYDDADKDSTDILSVSAWNGYVLRSVHGAPADTFLYRYELFNALDPSDVSYWNQADQYFDLTYYTDYIISESWVGNTDWPGNNIKIYRSNKTDFRYRFCSIDYDLSLAPYGWEDCYFDHIDYMLGQSTDNMFINVWLQSIQNNRYHDYFINRFADVMNTEYLPERLLTMEDQYFNEWVVEMQNEYVRWGDQNNIPQQMNDFYASHLTMQEQLSMRSDEVRDHIEENFSLPNQVDLTLDVHPAGAGKIHISTIEPTTYPWDGIYFNGVPIQIEAIENPGYHFVNWGNNGLISDVLNAVFLDTLDVTSIQFDAYFAGNVGLEEGTETASRFSLYPNPANNEMTLVALGDEAFGKLRLEMIDLTGRVVQTETTVAGQKATTVSTTHLPDGMYTLRISSPNQSLEQLRFVVIHAGK